MRAVAIVRTALICVVLILLHFTLRPLLAWNTSIDFLLIALVYGAVRMRPGMAAVYGLAIGLGSDSLALGAFGASALAMTAVGFTASWLKAVFFADNLALNAFFLFLGKWAFDLIFLLEQHTMSPGTMIVQLLVWSPLSAAVTAVAGVILITILRPLAEGKAP